jgi:glutamyl-tRNA synthetase
MSVFEGSVETESATERKFVVSRPCRGRYAPSPTGHLHLGNASTALAAWLSVRSRDGSFVMRMEDLDEGRVRSGLAESILEDLQWLGLDWDEGPDRGGPFAPYEQSGRAADYDRAFDDLRAAGRVYPCFCSRKDIAAAASAPQAPGDEARYPGTCRDLGPEEISAKLHDRRPPAWRFRVEPDQALTFVDQVRGGFGLPGGVPPGDFVIRRMDGVAAYQLAVVVDDAAMGITEVVRGDDLLPSTVRQLILYEALGHSPPGFAHVPLLLGPDGARLSKRHEGVTIRELRDAGLGSREIVGRLAHLIGLRPTPDPVRATDLIDGFTFDDLVNAPEGIPTDPTTWHPPPS